jgi:hypothetical protein
MTIFKFVVYGDEVERRENDNIFHSIVQADHTRLEGGKIIDYRCDDEKKIS